MFGPSFKAPHVFHTLGGGSAAFTGRTPGGLYRAQYRQGRTHVRGRIFMSKRYQVGSGSFR